MQTTTFITFLILGVVLWGACTWSTALSCDSCGRECASACGTRHFRTCCFNYLRKRDSPPGPSGLRLELWLAKSKASRIHGNPILNKRSNEPFSPANEPKDIVAKSELSAVSNVQSEMIQGYEDAARQKNELVDVVDLDGVPVIEPDNRRLQLIYDA